MTSFFCQSHSEWSTFYSLALCTFIISTKYLNLNASKAFIHQIQNHSRTEGSPFHFVRHYENFPFFGFFRKFLMSPKGPLCSFFDSLQQNGCKEILESLPFRFFVIETVQKSHFLSDVRFSQYISTDNFFNTIGILEVEVRNYCAISEFLTLYSNYIAFFYGGGGGSKTIAPFCLSRLYSNF